jgi:hypothetical protein
MWLPTSRFAFTAILIGVLVLLVSTGAIWRASFGLGQPSPDQRSTAIVPPSLRTPPFLSGPYSHGHSITQTLKLTRATRAITTWIAPGEGYDAAHALLEIRQQPDTGSIRSAMVPVNGSGHEVTLAIDPPLTPADAGPSQSIYLVLTAAENSPPIRVGITKGDAYPFGGSFIGDQPAWADQDVYFELVRSIRSSSDIHNLQRFTNGARLTRLLLIGLVLGGGATLAATTGRGFRTLLPNMLLASLALVFAIALTLDVLDVGLIPSPQFPAVAVLR